MNIIEGTNFITDNSVVSSALVVATDETSGGQLDIYVTPLLKDSELIEAALLSTRKIRDRSVRAYTVRLLVAFREVTKTLQRARVDISRFPPLRANILEDDSILIEWIFPDFRIGFNLEATSANNSWFLVTNKKLEEHSSTGDLSENNLESTVIRLFSFALANS